jgi:ABC-type multidrug transport system fused ATPase/permease subunit
MWDLIGKNKEAGYDEPPKPENWPRKNAGCSIRFENVSLTHPMLKEPVVNNLSFHVKSGENVVICGD